MQRRGRGYKRRVEERAGLAGVKEDVQGRGGAGGLVAAGGRSRGWGWRRMLLKWSRDMRSV